MSTFSQVGESISLRRIAVSMAISIIGQISRFRSPSAARSLSYSPFANLRSLGGLEGGIWTKSTGFI